MAAPVNILVCWNHRYIEAGAVQHHQDLINETGYAWWGKFYKENDNSAFTQLEPAEEPMNGDENYLDFVNKQIAEGIPTQLVILNPNPGKLSLYSATLNLVKFKMFGDVPPDAEWFNHVPDYYFKDDRPSDKQEDLKFLCRHWFKITGELTRMGLDSPDSFININEGRPLSFSRPNIYPMLVAHKAKWNPEEQNGKLRAYVDYKFDFVTDDNLRRSYRRRWREAQEQYRLGKYRHAVQDLASIVELLLDAQCGCATLRDGKFQKTIETAIERGFLVKEKSGDVADKIRDARNRVHLGKDTGRPVSKQDASELLDGFASIYKDIEKKLKHQAAPSNV